MTKLSYGDLIYMRQVINRERKRCADRDCCSDCQWYNTPFTLDSYVAWGGGTVAPTRTGERGNRCFKFNEYPRFSEIVHGLIFGDAGND